MTPPPMPRLAEFAHLDRPAGLDQFDAFMGALCDYAREHGAALFGGEAVEAALAKRRATWTENERLREAAGVGQRISKAEQQARYRARLRAAESARRSAATVTGSAACPGLHGEVCGRPIVLWRGERTHCRSCNRRRDVAEGRVNLAAVHEGGAKGAARRWPGKAGA